MVKTLIQLGADITAKTGANKSVLELCEVDEVYNYLKLRYEEHVSNMIANRKQTIPLPSDIGVTSITPTVAMPVVAPVSDPAVAVAVALAVDPPQPSEPLSNAPAVEVVRPVDAGNKKKRKVIVAHLEFDD